MAATSVVPPCGLSSSRSAGLRWPIGMSLASPIALTGYSYISSICMRVATAWAEQCRKTPLRPIFYHGAANPSNTGGTGSGPL